MTDRKKLEAALEVFRTIQRSRGADRDEPLDIMVEAVEAHLATLPKPMWKLRLWFPDTGDVHQIREWDTLNNAVIDASGFLARGACKVEIEAP